MTPHYKIMLNKKIYTLLISSLCFPACLLLHQTSAGALVAGALPETKQDTSEMHIKGTNLTQMAILFDTYHITVGSCSVYLNFNAD